MKRNRASLGISFTNVKPLQIMEVARNAGIRMEELCVHGNYKAKVSLRLLDRIHPRPSGKLICVSSMTPSPRGEGKTVISIALAEALALLKKKVMLCLGQPSPSPFFSRKGGAVGAGYAQLLPGDEINFHFTGDFHAAQSAANFLASVVDKHRRGEKAPHLDQAAIFWRRVADAHDGGFGEWPSAAFEPVSASEIISILTLSRSLADLKARLARIVVGLSKEGTPLTAETLRASGPMALLLRDAIEPNLVQTLDGQPCLVHMGPDDEASLGNPSAVSIQMAMRLADYVIVETAFGTDSGLQKFFDVVAPAAGAEPHAVIIVATLAALKTHGYENLERHTANVRASGLEPVVVLNRFPDDGEPELRRFTDTLRMKQIPSAIAQPVQQGGEGALELGDVLLKSLARKASGFKPAAPGQDVVQKCRAIARSIYGAADIKLSAHAKRDLEACAKLGLNAAPVNLVKTPYSLSDNASQKGVPHDWTLEISALRPQTGAGITTIYTAAHAAEASQDDEIGRFDIDDTGKMVESAS